MQDAKHTPGPWVATQDHSLRDPSAWVVKHKTPVAVSHIAQLHPASLAPEAGGSVAANARLIAAAPELLEALRLCIDAFAPGHGAASEDKRSAIDSAYAAIAKATTE